MRHTLIHSLLALTLLLCTGALPAANGTLEIIELRHRPAQELIPLIRPMLAEGAALTGSDFKLIIRTTPSNLEEIRKIVAKLDTAPRRLLITVRQDVRVEDTYQEGEVSGTISAGDDVTVSRPGDQQERGAVVQYDDGESQARARVLTTQRRDAERDTQQLQVLEGSSAFIRIGEEVPVGSRDIVHTPHGVTIEKSVEYRDVSSGFYVTPRVSGEGRVTLDIAPHRAALSREGGGRIDIHEARTTVSGRLGEWIELGGVATSRRAASGEILYSTHDRAAQRRRILVKVELLP
jgi:type II secretory pathway component GspD/PulD (secretin)